MSSDLKLYAEVNLGQDEYLLILEALEEKQKKHNGIYKRTMYSGYGTVTTELKALRHKKVSESCNVLISKLGDYFI